MHKILLPLITSLIVYSVHAQQKIPIDSLFRLVTIQENDTNKVNTLCDIAFFFINSNPDSTLAIGKRGLELAQELQYKLGEAKILSHLAKANQIKGNYPEALQYGKLSLAALNDAPKKPLSLESTIYNNLAIDYKNMDDFEQSLLYYEKSLGISKQLNDSLGIAKTTMNIGNLFGKQKLYQKAQDHYSEALQLLTRLKNSDMGKMMVYSNIGMTLYSQDKYSKAITAFKQALRTASSLNGKYQSMIMLQSVGECYVHLNKPDSARPFVEKLLTYCKELGNEAFQRQGEMTIGFIDFLTGDLKKSKRTALTSIQLYESESKHAQLFKSYKLMALISTAEGNHAAASAYMANYEKALRKIDNDEFERKLAHFQSKSEMQKKEHELELIKDENRIQSLQRNVAILASILIGLTLLLAVLYFINRKKIYQRKINDNNRQLAAQVMQLDNHKETLKNVSTLLEKVDHKLPEMGKVQQLVSDGIDSEDTWDKVQLHFNNVHPEFFEQLRTIEPELTTNDLKLAAYIKMNLSSKEISQLLNITHKSSQVAKYRLKKKLQLSEEQDLTKFIVNL
jgi:tetratricopeptide (TPR) repeat protein